MAEKLDVASLNFEQLLLARDIKLTIPRFQRSYCWEKPQIEMLFEDIESLFPRQSAKRDTDEETKFLGAIIFNRVKGSSGTRFENFDVIDGQQRLVTLYVLLCCAVRVSFDRAAALLNAPEIGDAEARVAKTLQDLAVMNAKGMVASRGDDQNKPKIVPSFNDMLEFDDAVDELNFLDPSPEPFDLAGAEECGALELAIKYIKSRMSEKMADETAGVSDTELLVEECVWLTRFLDIVTGRLEFIEVILAERHDPNQVFDRLNVQGQELTVLDLVRNQIFRVFADDDAAASRFYKNDWSKFEDELISPLDDLRDPENMEQYRKKQMDHKAGFWYPYALTINPDVTANPKKVFETLRSYWHGMGGTPSQHAKKILANLRKYVVVYNAITYAARPPSMDASSLLWQKTARISEYDIQRSTYGYLFQLLDWAFNHEEDTDDVCQCLDLIESYVMRRALCNDDGSIKNVFNPAWRVANFDPLLLQYQLDDKSRPFYSSDIVKESMKAEYANFYGLGKRARFFMAEKEKEITIDPYEPVNPQLDHVMPQNPSDDWAEVDEDDHEKYKNAVGNIVLLTHVSNNVKSNKSWNETVKIYNKSGTKQPRDLASLESWDIDQIRKRSTKLANWAVDKWKKPKIGSRHDVAKAMRDKLKDEQRDIARRLADNGIECGFIRKTKTGTNKGNITADTEIREFLSKAEIHNFEAQEVGSKHKIQIPAYFFSSGDWEETKISFTRVNNPPESRIWPLRINKYCPQWAVVAICRYKKQILLVNCSNPVILEEFIEFM